MKRDFSVWIVSPPGYLHSRCFEEVALALSAAFAELGFDAPVVTDPAQLQGTAIVFGTNLLPMLPAPLPPQLILYNLEQLQKDSTWFTPRYIDLLKRYPVWDYSTRNIKAFKAHGVEATLCGIGYMPALTRIAPAAAEDIDVLFVGSMNDRRKAALEGIARRGKNVIVGYNVYGEERDRLIARAKLVLNVHFYEAQLFEIVRVSYLLANKKCVVSETGHDAELETPLKDAVAFAPYAQLAETCLRLLDNHEARANQAEAGFERFRALSQVPMLKQALKKLN